MPTAAVPYDDDGSNGVLPMTGPSRRDPSEARSSYPLSKAAQTLHVLPRMRTNRG